MRWRKQQTFERRIRKRNHAFENESIRVGPPFIISSCTEYINWLFRMSAKCVRNLGKGKQQGSVTYSTDQEDKVSKIFEGFSGKRALGFLLKIELCRKRSKFRMQFCLGALNNVLHVFLLKFASFTRYYIIQKSLY